MRIDREKLNSIRQGLSHSEQNLKDILFEHSAEVFAEPLENPASIEDHLAAALGSIQKAITELLLIG